MYQKKIKLFEVFDILKTYPKKCVFLYHNWIVRSRKIHDTYGVQALRSTYIQPPYTHNHKWRIFALHILKHFITVFKPFLGSERTYVAQKINKICTSNRLALPYRRYKVNICFLYRYIQVSEDVRDMHNFEESFVLPLHRRRSNEWLFAGKDILAKIWCLMCKIEKIYAHKILKYLKIKTLDSEKDDEMYLATITLK